MSVEVVVAVGHDWEAELVTLLDATPGVTVARRSVDLADLLAAVAAGHGDVAVVSTDLRGLDRDAVSRIVLSGVRVVGATREGAEAEERHLRQLGIPAVLHARLDVTDISAVVESASGPAAHLTGATPEPTAEEESAGPDLPLADESPVPARGRVVAVWGATGAPGRTTVAVNVAAEAALLGVPVVLVDLDTYGAAVAQSLSLLDESPGMAAAARASELGNLDVAGLARLAPEVAPGLRVLTGILSPQRWPELRPAAVEHVLELARSLGSLVVLDLGFCIEEDEELSYDTAAPRRNGTTLVGLEQADELLLVGAGDPVSLQRMVRAVQSLASVPSPAPRSVVNRVRASAVGAGPEARIAESLERFAGIDAITFVPDDPEAADAAVLSGSALAECAPQSPARLALRELAASVAGVRAPRAERTRRRLRR